MSNDQANSKKKHTKKKRGIENAEPPDKSTKKKIKGEKEKKPEAGQQTDPKSASSSSSSSSAAANHKTKEKSPQAPASSSSLGGATASSSSIGGTVSPEVEANIHDDFVDYFDKARADFNVAGARSLLEVRAQEFVKKMVQTKKFGKDFNEKNWNLVGCGREKRMPYTEVVENQLYVGPIISAVCSAFNVGEFISDNLFYCLHVAFEGHPAALVLSSYSYTEVIHKGRLLSKGAFSGLSPENLYDCDRLIIPINIVEEQHWSVVVVDFKRREIIHWDSLKPMGKPRDRKIRDEILQYLVKEYDRRKKLECKESLQWRKAHRAPFFAIHDGWRYKDIEHPNQEDLNSCGVYAGFYVWAAVHDAEYPLDQA